MSILDLYDAGRVKLAKPRWAREIENNLNTPRGDAIAAKMHNAMPREIKHLGAGSDSEAILMAGRSPGQKMGPLYALKTQIPQSPEAMRAALGERDLFKKVLGPLAAETGGQYMQAGTGPRRGGLDIQEYVPRAPEYTAAHRMRNAAHARADASPLMDKHVLWDVGEIHPNNLRQRADGSHVFIDGHVTPGGPHSHMFPLHAAANLDPGDVVKKKARGLFGLVMEYDEASPQLRQRMRRESAKVLRGALQGSPDVIQVHHNSAPPLSNHSKYIIGGLAAAGLLAGGYGAYKYWQGQKRQREALKESA